MSKEFEYDEVSHELDEQLEYKILPQFPNCWVFYPSEFIASKYETEYDREIISELLKAIKDECIRSTEDNVYIIKQDKMEDILQNFYEKGKDK